MTANTLVEPEAGTIVDDTPKVGVERAPRDYAALAETLQEVFGDKYTNIRFWKDGGTRHIFEAAWGPSGLPVLLKVDKKPVEIDSPRAGRHFARGYDTAHELEVLAKLRGLNSPYFTRLIGFEQLGNGMALSEEKVRDAMSLEELLTTTKGRVKPSQSVEILKQLANGSYTLAKQNLLHRDLKPSNVLVRGTNGDTEVIITDYANTGSKDKIHPSPLPTAGGHGVLDPLLVSSWTGAQRVYDEDSEVYAITTDFAISALGRQVFDFNPDTNTARVVETGENLLDTNGKLDRAKYSAALKSLKDKWPKDLKRYWGIVEKGLSLDDRYQTLAAFKESVDRYSAPTLLEKLKKNSKLALVSAGAAAVLSTLALLGPFGAMMMHTAQKSANLEAKLAEDSKKITIAVDQNGKGLEIDNNIVNMQDPTIFIHRGKDYLSYPKQVKIIEAKQGETLDIYVPLKEKPWKSSSEVRGLALPTFRGRVYMEGYEPTQFFSSPDSFNEAYYRDFGGPTTGNPQYKIPANMEDGVHNLIIEIDAPSTKKAENVTDASSGLRDVNEDQIISRKVIPIIVGSPKERIRLHEAQINGYQNELQLSDISGDYSEKVPSNLTYTASISSVGYSTIRSNDDRYASSFQNIGLNIPKITNTETRVLGMIARNGNGDPVYSAFIPIKSEDIIDRKKVPNAEPCYWTKLATPGTNFWKQVRQEKEYLYSQKAKERQVGNKN